MTPEQAAALRAPFPPETIGKLPKGGATLDYVGHAAVTDRLLAVDPGWTWEPVAWDDDGTPLVRVDGNDASMWIRLTVAGVTRLGVGTVPATSFELPKQLVSDALRNAAMRFGVALDLWSREDLHAEPSPPPPPKVTDAQASTLAARFEEIPAGDRKTAKRAFASLFGVPVDVEADRYDDAVAWLDEQIAAYTPLDELPVYGDPLELELEGDAS